MQYIVFEDIVLVLCFGGFYARATPDLIPNSEVKPCSSDDTLLEGKVASRQNTELKPKNTTQIG